eukprot:TRINITY_DN12057_c0_g1_i1.p1 TRINITY_DN12057_c0_g1~~TRINITY_DN12057_c0_g1_i1.p1  ORF type:complete len:214 (-),score=23.58 TRINITY_DN12057_c0_g1_i1:35-676(-)
MEQNQSYLRQRVEVGERTLTILQQPTNTISTGTKLWSSSLFMSAWLDKNKSKFKLEGRKVLELGCGCGLGGFSFMLRGANVTLTDVEELMPLLKANVSANFSSEEMKEMKSQVLPFYWGTDPSKAGLEPPYDYIIGADIVYKADLVEPLVQSMLQLSDESTQIIIALEPRDPIVFEQFINRCEEVFSVRRVRKALLPDTEDAEWVHIYQMRKK